MTHTNPTIDEWLQLPVDQLAALIAPHNLTVLLSIDGTRRHYLLAQGDQAEQISNFAAYARHAAAAYVRVYDLLFGMGVHTVLTPMLYPPNFARGDAYLYQALVMSHRLLCDQPFTGLYERWGLAARLYGDYDLAEAAAPVRANLDELARELVALTPSGERRLFVGYQAGNPADELIARTVALHQALGRTPTASELRAACFPAGPDAVDILIGAGWLRVGAVLPAVLDAGRSDIYNLASLALDLQAVTLRHILYDHLYRRWQAPEDDASYSTAELGQLAHHYATHRQCVLGLGELVGPGLWYAQHTCAADAPLHERAVG